MNGGIQIGKLGLLIICALMVITATYATQDYLLNHKTTLVFCDVGQGDGAYLRINNRIDVLIDAGPEHSILTCLGKHMPFYDRTIEFGFVSHPQADHYGGFIDIMQRYRLRTLFINTTTPAPEGVQSLLEQARAKGVTIMPFVQGNTLKLYDASFESKWPTRRIIDKNTPNVDPNDLSQIIRFKQRSLTVLFTGDITPTSDKSLLQQSYFGSSLIKIPHHGSLNGLTMGLIPLADPRVAVISVGRKNRYGHPSSAILEYLKEQGIKILRTDELGDIAFHF